MTFAQHVPTNPKPELCAIYTWRAQIKTNPLPDSIEQIVNRLHGDYRLMVFRVTYVEDPDRLSQPIESVEDYCPHMKLRVLRGLQSRRPQRPCAKAVVGRLAD